MPRLTKRVLDQLDAQEKDYICFDETLPGFGVRVMPSGRKTFLVQYRSGGRTRRVKIGVYGAVTPDEARRKAKNLLGRIADGDNPAETIEKDRRAPTVASLCERFLTDHVALRCKPTTERDYIRTCERIIKPRLGTFKVEDVSRADISALHHSMRTRPYVANRTLSVLSKMFNLAELWGLRRDGSNPCRLIKKYPEQKKERFLSDKEIARLHATLDDIEASGTSSPYPLHAFRLLIATGCRCSEIQTLKWEYIRGDTIHLPDSKTGARRIPVTPPVRAALDRIEPIEGNPYVIAGSLAGHHHTDLQRPWRRIRKKAGIEDVRIHDLRHTYASKAIAAGLSLELIGKLLGHTQFQTTLRYAHLADEPLREAAKIVSEHLSGPSQKAQIIPLHSESKALSR